MLTVSLLFSVPIVSMACFVALVSFMSVACILSLVSVSVVAAESVCYLPRYVLPLRVSVFGILILITIAGLQVCRLLFLSEVFLLYRMVCCRPLLFYRHHYRRYRRFLLLQLESRFVLLILIRIRVLESLVLTLVSLALLRDGGLYLGVCLDCLFLHILGQALLFSYKLRLPVWRYWAFKLLESKRYDLLFQA